MSEEILARSELDRRYSELVRLAYLVLPGDHSRKYRLALARRIVGENLPRAAVRHPDRAHARARSRVLARAMRPGRRLRIGLGRWHMDHPVPLPDLPGHVAALAPEVRVAYVLRRIESRHSYAVHDQLVELGVPDAPAVLAAADLLAAPPTPLAVPAVRRGPIPRSRMPLAITLGLTAVLAGAIVLEPSRRPAVPPPSGPVAVTARPMVRPARAPSSASPTSTPTGHKKKKHHKKH